MRFPANRFAVLLAATIEVPFGCTLDTDPCMAVDCRGWGVCKAIDGAPVCMCDPGYVSDGDSCIPDTCTALACAEHGVCVIDEQRPYCACDLGYTGDNCGACADEYQLVDGSCIKPTACADNTCSQHGTCSVESGNVTCSCDAGYKGRWCTQCVDGYVSAGNGRCEPAVDPCTTNPCTDNVCSGHGTCSCAAADGTLSCACATGYKGLDCKQCASGYVKNPSTGACEAEVVVDLCEGVTCADFWKACDPTNGSCAVKTGYCANTAQCGPDKVCPSGTHQCVANPCPVGACSGHGVCTTVDGVTPECSCEHLYTPSGNACVAATNLPGWCSIRQVGSTTTGNTIEVDEGTAASDATAVYGEVWKGGVTDQTGAGAKVKAQLGVTTTIPSYPVVVSDYTWIDATFDGDGANGSGQLNNDIFKAQAPTAKAGVFNLIYRFSVDDGATWAYCRGPVGSGGFISSSPLTGYGTATVRTVDPCGGACADWQVCSGTSCVAKTGRCGDNDACTAPKTCDLSTHACSLASHSFTCSDSATSCAPAGTVGPALTLCSYSSNAQGYEFVVDFTPGSGGQGIDFAASRITMNGAAEVTPSTCTASTRRIAVLGSGVNTGKYTYLFRLKDTAGTRVAKDLYVPLWVEETPFAWRDMFIYQAMTDRFLNADTSNDWKVPNVDDDKNWMGGDFKGITQKIESGYFAAMGVNAIWISSPILNTDGRGKDENSGYPKDMWFSAYHSYWPIATGWTDTNHLPLTYRGNSIDSAIEPHFGTEAELHALIQAAHAQGIRVLADLVTNHVLVPARTWSDAFTGSTSPWVSHPEYFINYNGPTICPPGKWTSMATTCWFTDYLGDLDFTNSAVVNLVADHAVWMTQEFDFDGFRLDALKHMDMAAVTGLRAKVKSEVETTDIRYYMVGETLVNDAQYLFNFVGDDRADGQVECNVQAATGSIYNGNMSSGIKATTDWNDNWYSSRWAAKFSGVTDDLMVNYLNTHDNQRLLRSAGGHANMRLGMTFMMTSPRIAHIWQGDDIGMDGGYDPDNRRMMSFGLSSDETATLNHLRKLGLFRQAHIAARRGARSTCEVGEKYWVYTMTSGTDVVVAGINRDGSNHTVTCSGVTGSFKDAFTGAVQSYSGSFTVPAGGSLVLGKVQQTAQLGRGREVP